MSGAQPLWQRALPIPLNASTPTSPPPTPGEVKNTPTMLRLPLLTPAERDQDHIPAVLWSDPRVPDRTRGKLAGGEDPLPWLLRGIAGLRHAGCGAIAIPCNTAHGWYDAMEAAADVPILHI